MVTIAIAGGTGQVAQEVLDALIATKKHNLMILTRKAATETPDPGVSYQTVNYDDRDDLVQALRGVHTLLSFIQILSDPDQKAQRNMIDAAIAAGVKRFSPSEYGSAGTANMPWWEGKEKIREYLKQVNKNDKVLEYTLFQPGLFLDYLAYPHKTAKYLNPLQTVFDFQHRRAIVVDGHEHACITVTTAADFAAVVARACGYVGEWPTVGGIQGNVVTVSQILDIGARARGRAFAIEKVKLQDLEDGKLETSWALEARHEAVSDEQAKEMLKQVSIGMLLSTAKAAWEGSGEMNRLFLDHEFLGIEEFLAAVWEGKE